MTQVKNRLIFSLFLSILTFFIFNNQFGQIKNVVTEESCYFVTKYGFPLIYNYSGKIFLEKLLINFVYIYTFYFLLVSTLFTFFGEKNNLLNFKSLSISSFLIILTAILYLLLGLDSPNGISCRPFTIYEQREIVITFSIIGLGIWLVSRFLFFVVTKFLHKQVKNGYFNEIKK